MNNFYFQLPINGTYNSILSEDPSDEHQNRKKKKTPFQQIIQDRRSIFNPPAKNKRRFRERT